MNVLCIDDNKESLDYIQEVLEGEGFHVIPCQESHTSLKILDTIKIHCIVTDLKMPIIDGSDLIKLFAAKYPQIPIIVLSGHIGDQHGFNATNVFIMLKKPLEAINVGLESFHLNLKDQGVPSVHLDWKPEAGGNEKLIGILERMKKFE